MHIVYVKHYLNSKGIIYATTQWFKNVKMLMNQQKGYISVEYELYKEYEDCLSIIIKFKDQTCFQAWVMHPEHEDLVNSLEAYRSRNYWEYATGGEDAVIEADIEWHKVTKLK